MAADLRDLGVAEFSWGGAYVKFQERLSATKALPQTISKTDDAPKAVKPTDVYHNPALWGGSSPPLFPGQVEKDKTP